MLDALLDPWLTADRPAVITEDADYGFDQMRKRIEATAAGMADHGVGHGDRVIFCGLNRVEMLEALLACSRLGAMLSPVNNRLTASEIAFHLADAEPSLLLATDGFAALLAKAAAINASAVAAAPLVDLDTTPLAESSAPVPPRSGSIDDPVLIVYTSGTTGTPKGAVLTQEALLHTWENGIAYQNLDAHAITLAPLPMFHVGGLNIQTLPTLLVGGTVIIQRRFSPGAFLQLITDHRPTHTILVPAMLRAVSDHPDFLSTDVSSLVSVSTGSSVVPDEVMRPYFERGLPVCQVYGTTETGPTSVVLSNEDAMVRVGSCGQAAPHTELRVVDDTGRDCEPGTTGEVWLKGTNLFGYYWRNETATKDAFADGWYRTGDIGYLDKDAYLTIVDRVTDLIISGGENIYPSEVEAVLALHPAIADAALIGRPNERWGETPVAVIVPRVGADRETLAIDALRSWCDERLARFKQPSDVVLVEELPRTSLGKVRKHTLRELFLSP